MQRLLLLFACLKALGKAIMSFTASGVVAVILSKVKVQNFLGFKCLVGLVRIECFSLSNCY